MTLAEVRVLALVRGGRCSLNGTPHLPGSEVMCSQCRREVEDDTEVVVAIVSHDVTVSHMICPA
jgi:hypothetical protein